MVEREKDDLAKFDRLSTSEHDVRLARTHDPYETALSGDHLKTDLVPFHDLDPLVGTAHVTP